MIPTISVPTLILDEQKVRGNIARMTQKVRGLGLAFRPHFKTHQSAAVGEWFREAGVDRITVSSLRMATYFAKAGWTDITNAFPVNILEMSRINELAGSVKLKLIVENTEAIEALGQQLDHPVGLFIKLNAGNNRTGLLPTNMEEITTLVRLIKNFDKLSFAGFLGHAGQTYRARGKEEIINIHQASLRSLQPVIDHFRADYPDLIFSYGDTPSGSTATNFPGVDELRPGNFVFYDLTQATIGSCTLDDIAVAMACPVVSKHPDRQEVVVYGGGVHFSKDRLERNGKTTYGQPVKWTDDGWEVIDDGQSYVRKLSQEHGVVRLSPELFRDTNIGDVMGIVPVHSCMTADLMKAYQTLEGTAVSMLTYV